MMSSVPELQALQRAAQELERPLAALEERLLALGEALRLRDADRIETEAHALHAALAAAVDQFGRARRQGPIPPELRQRLMHAGAQVAAQREILARATASLDRAMDVLMPGSTSSVYAAGGYGERQASGGQTHA